MRNFLWDREAVKRHIKGVILKYLDSEGFFFWKKSLWLLCGNGDFFDCLCPSFPTVYTRNPQAELQERLGFTFTIFQWVCDYLRVFVRSLVRLIKWGVIPELPRKDLSAFCEIFVWNSQVFMLLIKKIQNTFILFREDRSEQNKKVKIKDCLFQCSAQGAHYWSNFLKRSKAVLIFLDPSPERKPSVMKSLWKGYFWSIRLLAVVLDSFSREA